MAKAKNPQNDALHLLPGDILTGCAYMTLKRMPELYLQCCQAVLATLSGSDNFHLVSITLHGDGSATAAFEKWPYQSSRIPKKIHEVHFQAFRDGQEARAYCDRKRKEWEDRKQIICGLRAAFGGD